MDRLLASPAFGERWARHWLDLTGYADQIGTANDIFAEHAWRYRDYVIDGVQRRHARSIASSASRSPATCFPVDTVAERARNLIATGFLVLGDLTVVEADKAKLRVDVIDQQVDKVGKAFLGLTIGCADATTTSLTRSRYRDYYALAGIFSSTESVGKAEWGVWSWPTVDETAGNPGGTGEPAKPGSSSIGKRIDDAQGRTRAGRAPHRGDRRDPPGQGQGREMTQSSRRPARLLEKERRELEARVGKLARDIEHAEFFAPAEPVAFAVHDSPSPADMRITIRGNAHALGDVVPRGFVRVVCAETGGVDPVRARAVAGNWPTGSPAATIR